jgi:hypothetical protein
MKFTPRPISGWCYEHQSQTGGAAASTPDGRVYRFSRMKTRIQNISKRDPGRFIVQRYADEGAGFPFVARIFLNILRLREQVYPDAATATALTNFTATCRQLEQRA